MSRWYWRCELCGARSGGFRSFRKYSRAWSRHRFWYHARVT